MPTEAPPWKLPATPKIIAMEKAKRRSALILRLSISAAIQSMCRQKPSHFSPAITGLFRRQLYRTRNCGGHGILERKIFIDLMQRFRRVLEQTETAAAPHSASAPYRATRI